MEAGRPRAVATVLVFYLRSPEASSRTIERATDLRQPEVSNAMRYSLERGWVTMQEVRESEIGRPRKVYALAMPVSTILDDIETEKNNNIQRTFALMKKAQELC